MDETCEASTCSDIIIKLVGIYSKEKVYDQDKKDLETHPCTIEFCGDPCGEMLAVYCELYIIPPLPFSRLEKVLEGVQEGAK